MLLYLFVVLIFQHYSFIEDKLEGLTSLLMKNPPINMESQGFLDKWTARKVELKSFIEGTSKVIGAALAFKATDAVEDIKEMAAKLTVVKEKSLVHDHGCKNTKREIKEAWPNL